MAKVSGARSLSVRRPPAEIIGFTRSFVPVYKTSSASSKRTIAYPVNSPALRGAYNKKKATPETEKKIVKKLAPDQVRALAVLPQPLQKIMRDVATDTQTNAGIKETMNRATEFSSPTTALFVGAYLDPVSRRKVNDNLDEMWSTKPLPPNPDAREIVVGGGLHAAIYCAVRAATGHKPPIVLEARGRVGGAFAISRGASFYLNSRNRPGPLSIPGEGYGLNVIPGAILQPSDLGGEEYQTNEVLAWVVRLTLAMYGDVYTNAVVQSYGDADSANWAVELTNAQIIPTDRIVFATGLGEPKNSTGLEHKKILSFDTFMRSLSEPFPLKGMKRVAVIGGGDGAKTAIEALCGQGPVAMTVASMDWPEEIDWYGASWLTCSDCTANARVRYKRLSSLLPDPESPGRTYRVRTLDRSDVFSAGYDAVYVGQLPYDYLIDATGYVEQPAGSSPAIVNEIRTGLKLNEDVYVIGPAANLSVSESEKEVLRNIDENKTSIFRYAMRTATLAASLS